LDLASAPYLIATPYLFGLVGRLAAGRISDSLYRRGVRTRTVRKVINMSGGFGMAVALAVVPLCSTPELASAALAAATLCGRAVVISFVTNITDICPSNSGTLMGAGTTIGLLAAIAAQPAAQTLLETTGSFAAVFWLAAAISVAGSLLFAVFADDKVIDKQPLLESELATRESP
jgi:hypothetical protein